MLRRHSVQLRHVKADLKKFALHSMKKKPIDIVNVVHELQVSKSCSVSSLTQTIWLNRLFFVREQTIGLTL